MTAPVARLTFLGAAGEVTGSMLRIDTRGGSLLVDCGLFQGRRAESARRNRQLPGLAIDADAAILTHAHIDHSGSLPTLVRAGFRGAIHATPATYDLCTFMLRDSAHLQEADAEYLNRKFADDPDFEPVVPLYREADVLAALERFVVIPYRHRFEPIPGVTATLLDAGHILGAAQVVLDIAVPDGSRRVVVSGDLGRRGLPILRDPEPPPRPIHALVMESTYGNRQHGDVGSLREEVARVVRETCDRGGKIVVPAFAVGRTQEVLYVLRELREAGRLPRIPVFVDSPLATDVTGVFRAHPECYDVETRTLIEGRGELFSFEGLEFSRTRDSSMAINDVPGPAIIIAGSGMAEGGRVLHHLRNLVEDDRNTVMIIGFMAQHTLGRRIAERRPRVRIWGVERELHARVEILDGFSAHADRDDLLRYVETCGGATLERVFLVHGEPDQQEPLRAELVSRGVETRIPKRGDVVTIDP
jgi:metallo-beta-lactamase family protein